MVRRSNIPPMAHPLVLAVFASSGRRGGRRPCAARTRASRATTFPWFPGAMTRKARSPNRWMRRRAPISRIHAPAARLGELGGQVLAAIAVVMPGIGPIVAAGPLSAGLGEAAGHVAGGLASALKNAGVPAERADHIVRRHRARQRAARRACRRRSDLEHDPGAAGLGTSARARRRELGRSNRRTRPVVACRRVLSEDAWLPVTASSSTRSVDSAEASILQPCNPGRRQPQ